MRSGAARAALFTFVAGVAVVLLLAATDQRHLAFSLAVRASEPGVVVYPGHEACQRDIDVEERFDSVTILPAAYFKPVPRLELRVLDRPSGRTIAIGVLPVGHLENRATTIRLAPAVPRGRRVDICFRNAGAWKVALFSGPATDNEPSFGTLDGRLLPSDILIDFVRSEPRSTLSLIPDIFRRAALFHPSWVGAWTFWILAAVLVLAVPAALVAAVRAAGEEPADRVVD
jgi:hypothetical protein